MKSLRSCLLALIVMALIALGAYWVYQNLAPGGARSASLLSVTTQPRLTLSNGTNFRLTVTLRGPAEERFNIASGQSESREIPAGEYEVEGRIDDPSTDPFTASWEFEPGGTYNAGFSRSGETGAIIIARPEAK